MLAQLYCARTSGVHAHAGLPDLPHRHRRDAARTPYRACPACGTAFLSPDLRESHARSNNDFPHAPMSPHDREVNRQLAQWLVANAMGGKPGRVLDVGCGEPVLARSLADLGCEAIGLDVDPRVAERGSAARHPDHRRRHARARALADAGHRRRRALPARHARARVRPLPRSGRRAAQAARARRRRRSRVPAPARPRGRRQRTLHATCAPRGRAADAHVLGAARAVRADAQTSSRSSAPTRSTAPGSATSCCARSCASRPCWPA